MTGRILSFCGLSVFLCSSILAREAVQEVIPNWPTPPFWSPPEGSRAGQDGAAVQGKPSRGIHPLQVEVILPGAFAFIPVTPCRQYDSRNFTPLPDNTSRTVTVSGAPCGIPLFAAGVSVNITIFNIIGAPSNGVFRVGIVSPPPTAWINFPPTETQRGNAGIVATNGAGQIVVQVNMGAGQLDFTVDVNGFYAGSGTSSANNTFLGIDAGNSTMTGDRNTGIGALALLNNTSGSDNTATGRGALATNTMGARNTATGLEALRNNTIGDSNTAIGFEALFANMKGSGNTASGNFALGSNTSGDNNIALGVSAGSALTTGSDNICIGNGGLPGESNTIRIGSFVHQAAFIQGIFGVPTAGVAVPVVIDSSGQLGTTSSSARFKEEIEDMRETSSALLKLRPVTFRYKGQPEGHKPLHFGLIAEEVEKTLPELVVHSPSGDVQTVLYHEMPAMLLNELQKQQRRIAHQDDAIRALEARLVELEGALRGGAKSQ